MGYLNKHSLGKGFDRDLIFIKDRLLDYFKSVIEKDGFEHSFDDYGLLKDDVKKINKCAYGYIDGEIVLVDTYKSLQKARERIFEILCSLRISLEHLGRFTLETSSYNDEEFYLISKAKKNYKIVVANLIKEDKLISIRITSSLIDYICDYCLPLKVRKKRFGLITFDSKQSAVLKIKKILKDNYDYLEVDSKDSALEELLPYCLIITHTLAKKSQIKLVSLVEDFERNIDIDSLEKMLELYDKKLISILYNLTLKEHLSKTNETINLCKKCAENNGNVVKDFRQNLALKKCSSCAGDKEVFTYIKILED